MNTHPSSHIRTDERSLLRIDKLEEGIRPLLLLLLAYIRPPMCISTLDANNEG